MDKKILIKVSNELHKALRIDAAVKDTHISKVVNDILEKQFIGKQQKINKTKKKLKDDDNVVA